MADKKKPALLRCLHCKIEGGYSAQLSELQKLWEMLLHWMHWQEVQSSSHRAVTVLLLRIADLTPIPLTIMHRCIKIIQHKSCPKAPFQLHCNSNTILFVIWFLMLYYIQHKLQIIGSTAYSQHENVHCGRHHHGMVRYRWGLLRTFLQYNLQLTYRSFRGKSLFATYIPMDLFNRVKGGIITSEYSHDHIKPLLRIWVFCFVLEA